MKEEDVDDIVRKFVLAERNKQCHLITDYIINAVKMDIMTLEDGKRLLTEILEEINWDGNK